VVSSITPVFLESSSTRAAEREVISTWFLLDCRKLTRSKLVQCFNCEDLNEEMKKQHVSDKLLTRRNNLIPVIRFVPAFYQLGFSCFLLVSVSHAASLLLRFDYLEL